jgi:hypothetical protein
LNNAIESTTSKISVFITLRATVENIQLTIKDNGPGITENIKNQIFKRGYTTKEQGNGLGLSHAQQCIEQWNGSIEIDSDGNGTTVSIILPLKLSKPGTSSSSVVLIDDDELIHFSWTSAAQKSGINLVCYTSYKDLFVNIEQFDKSTPFYIDSDLNDELTGEQIAKKLYDLGYSELYLATGYEAEKFKNCDFLKGIQGKEPPKWRTC